MKTKKYCYHIIRSLLALIIIVIINFFLVHLNNIDPLYALSGIDGEINEVVKAKITSEYGLDKPLVSQFFIYFKNTLTFNLGYSYQNNLSVLALILKRIGLTLMISLPSLLLSAYLGLVLGMHGGYNKHQNLNKINKGLIYILHSAPGFVIGLFLLLIFGYYFKWFPLSGKNSLRVSSNDFIYVLDTIYHLILPIITLTLIMLPSNYFIVEKLVIQEKNKKYVQYALMRGFGLHHVLYKEILLNIDDEYLMHLGNRFALALGSSLIVENIFSLNGLGTLLYNSAINADYPLTLGTLYVICLFGVIINIIFDTFIYVKSLRRRRYIDEN